MTHKYCFPIRLLVSAAAMAILLHIPSPLYAQEERIEELENLNRLNALEEELHELRGQLEETQHQLSSVTKQIETLSADIDYRLNNPDSATTPPLPKTVDAKTSDALSLDKGYESARTLLEQGDYEAAERAFAAFLTSNPKDNKAGAAQYWLGVSFFVRGQHEKAVSAFAKGYKNYPKSEKAGDNLLKLAKSLCALDRKADACTTLDQLGSEHPKFSPKEVASERKKLNCK